MSRFEKITYEQFEKDVVGQNYILKRYEDVIEKLYEGIKLPKRATQGSAGYDFFSSMDFDLRVNESIIIPTGIRWVTSEHETDTVLKIYPRSGHGFKYRVQLDNTVGIIDSDYCFSDNEGHIWVKLTNDGKEDKILSVKVGEGFAQGIIEKFYLTDDDMADGIRNGGFGSTSKQMIKGKVEIKYAAFDGKLLNSEEEVKNYTKLKMLEIKFKEKMKSN